MVKTGTWRKRGTLKLKRKYDLLKRELDFARKCQFTVQDVKTDELKALIEVGGVWHYPTARFSPAMPEALIKEMLEKELLKHLRESGAIKYDCVRYSERPIMRATLEIVRR